jgi:hypothetical protein
VNALKKCANAREISSSGQYQLAVENAGMKKLTVYIPEEHLEGVKQALFDAGAGRYAAYDHCCWQVAGTGQFRPLKGSHPAIGEVGQETRVSEYRVEMICEDACVGAVTAALRAAHPYEEPAFDFVDIHMGV